MKLGPLIHKNLDTHEVKSLKSNLMYTVTICFLVFSGSNLLSLQKYAIEMSHIVFGSDLSVRSVDTRGQVSIDEFKVRKLLDTQLEAQGGILTGYSFLSAGVPNQMYAPG